MQLGVVFPTTEIGTDPAAIRDYAQAADELGYDYLLTYDHVLGADPSRHTLTGPYTHETQFHEPFVLFGYLAALTVRIQLVTGIVILPQRQTALVAKQAAEVDLLSGGRLTLGVGLGWNQVEYEALGKDFRNRGRRIEEQVQLLRRLLDEPLVEFEGEYERVAHAGIAPLPPHRIPIWFGGNAEAVYERIGRLGDGWLLNRGRPADFEERRGRIEAAARAAGRDPADLGYGVQLPFSEQPEEVSARVEEWAAAGATHVHVGTMGQGFTPAQHIEAIRQFKASVGAIAEAP